MNIDTAAPEVDYISRYAQLTARYQAALERAGGVRCAVDADGAAALADLVDDILPLLRTIAVDKLTARFGTSWPSDMLQDATAEMVAAVIDAAARFDPQRCASFHSWVTGEQGAARAALFAYLNFADGWGEVPERTRRTLSIARQAEADLAERLGRSPTIAELQEEMTEYCFRYQFERLTPAQQALPEQDWRKLARAKLVNNGLIAGIRDVEMLRARSATPVSPEEFATGWDFVETTTTRPATALTPTEEREERDDMTALVRVALAGLSASDQRIVAARLDAAAGEDASFTAVASRFRVPVARVKEVVADATSRMGAAHAHFAFLAAGVPDQFEEAPSPVRGVAGVLARLQPALG